MSALSEAIVEAEKGSKVVGIVAQSFVVYCKVCDWYVSTGNESKGKGYLRFHLANSHGVKAREEAVRYDTNFVA